MGIDAGTPPGLAERIRKIADEAVAKYAKSGFLRNASISDGGLTIKGGFLRLLSKAAGGQTIFYIGPTGDALPDGTPQQGWIVRRGDGTNVLDLYDADVTDGQLNQALNWRDRGGNVVIADDTNAGQGLARPYLQVPFYRVRDQDWPTTTSTSFQAMYRARVPKQQPRLYVRAWGTGVGASTGEMRVMVNGVQLGSTGTLTAGTVTSFTFGPDAVAGDHMATLTVELQVRMTGGTEGVRCCVAQAQGQQS
jgi:hypothetical protein